MLMEVEARKNARLDEMKGEVTVIIVGKLGGATNIEVDWDHN